MEIYGMIVSPFVARVIIAARYKGIKHTLTMPKDQKAPAFLKINPLGKIPALKDGGVTLFESSVIVEYLEAKSKKNKLVPTGAKAAAKIRLVGALFAEYVQGPILQLFNHMDPAKRDQAFVDAKLAEINKGLDVVESLMGKPFAAGKFSLADCYAIPTMFFIENLMAAFVPDPLRDRPKLRAYRARLSKDKLSCGILDDMAESLRALMAKISASKSH